MAVIGYTKSGSGSVAVDAALGYQVPLVGISANALSKTGVFPNWSDPVTWTNYGALAALSIYATDDDAGNVSKLTAYLLWSALEGIPNTTFQGALYDAAGNLLGATQSVVKNRLDTPNPGWVDLPFAAPVVITYGAPLVLAVWGNLSPTGIAKVYGDATPDAGEFHPVPAGVTEITVTDAVRVAEPTMARGHAMTITDAVGAVEPARATLIAACWGRYINLRDMLGI